MELVPPSQDKQRSYIGAEAEAESRQFKTSVTPKEPARVRTGGTPSSPDPSSSSESARSSRGRRRHAVGRGRDHGRSPRKSDRTDSDSESNMSSASKMSKRERERRKRNRRRGRGSSSSSSRSTITATSSRTSQSGESESDGTKSSGTLRSDRSSFRGLDGTESSSTRALERPRTPKHSQRHPARASKKHGRVSNNKRREVRVAGPQSTESAETKLREMCSQSRKRKFTGVIQGMQSLPNFDGTEEFQQWCPRFEIQIGRASCRERV